MLSSLKFVQGAVAKKDFVPEMTHFEIKNSRITAFNGAMALSTPIPFDIDCNPKAVQLVKAISQCEDTVSISMTNAGRLKVQSGAFKVFVDCIAGEGLNIQPEGEFVELNGDALLKAFTTLLPFIGNDASRPWSNGILIDNQSAFATNNVCLVEYWLGVTFPHKVNIPIAAVKEMLRIKEAPLRAQLGDNSITFLYSGDRWLRTQLYDSEWPDLGRILNVECNPHELDTKVFAALQTIKPFVDKLGKVYIKEGVVSTHVDADIGANYTIEDKSLGGIYNHEMLALLDGVATSIDMATYPRPCLFFGDNLRGAIIGMKE